MGSTNSSLQKSRAPVDISDDDWLETLRSLSFPQWSKVRLVSRQINGVAQRNVSILPCAIIYSANTRPTQRSKILASIPATDAIQWFKNRNIILDIPTGIQLDNAIIGINLKENRCVDITVFSPAPQKQVVFCAKFRSTYNKNSWASMKFFHHPVTHFKESLSWLEKNVQAETIDFSNVTKKKKNLEEISNFYFDFSWKCDKLETIKVENPDSGIGNVDYVTSFMDVLVKKFRSIVSLPGTFPTIVVSGYLPLEANNSMKAPISGEGVIAEGRDDSGCGIAYVVSKGPNQMRVECSRKYRDYNHVVYCQRGSLIPFECRSYTSRQYNIRIVVYKV